MPTLPSTIALTSIATNSEILSVDHRNNYTAIQTAVNSLIAALSGGTSGQFLTATSSTAVSFGNPSYSAYTPTWTASGTAPAIGNSTVVARYTQIGKHVHATGAIQFGNTATYGTGQYSFALPVTAFASSNVLWGQVLGVDASTGNLVQAMVLPGSVTTFQGMYGATYLGASTFIGQTAPWTWTTSDVVYWNLLYEAA